MSKTTGNDGRAEFNGLFVDEVLRGKETSHETGEYNEFAVSGLFPAPSEEESSSSEEKNSTSKAMGVVTAVGMGAGIGGIVVGTIAALALSLTYLPAETIVGIGQAQCYFELANGSYEDIAIRLEEESGAPFQQIELERTPEENRYVASFSGLAPDSAYSLVGVDGKGREIDLGADASFRTLPIPSYEVEVDLSSYDKAAGVYDLSFLIDNPEGYLIEARLICLSDPSLSQSAEARDEAFAFRLPTVLSSYRLELYQEGYLVGEAAFSDYEGLEILDGFPEIGLSSVFLGLSPGEIDPSRLAASLALSARPEEELPLEPPAPDGPFLYVSSYDLTPSTDYLLRLYDASRPSFTYFSYPFRTGDVPRYEIAVDESSFDPLGGNYELTFLIDNPAGSFVDAELRCLNDPTLDVYDSFFGDSLTLTLPLLYSAYRLDLFQEGYEVGSHSFSYYSPMEVPPDTLEITASSFGLEVKRGDVPLESLRAFLLPGQGNGDPIELEIVPRDGSSRLYLAMEGLSSGTSYTLQIVDRSRETTVYLSYSFVTLTS